MAKLRPIVLSILSVIAKPLAVDWAYRRWFRSPRYPTPGRENRWREQSCPAFITTRFGRVMTYHWGESDRPRIFLVHGWSGRGTQLAACVESLLTAGYSVTSFDAPGHGESEGNATSLFEIAEVLSQIVREAKQPYALIGHSFGGIVCAYALRHEQLPMNKLVTISCPVSTKYLFDGYIRHLRLNSTLSAALYARYQKAFGADVFERTAADHNLLDWPGKALVIHDKDDEVVDWHFSERLAQSAMHSEVLYTHGLGHRRILRDKTVISHVVKFLSGSVT
jgi:pimeloyl-ACP methyl ester carboxylesterase